jgi:hypothetical protein
MNPWSDDMNRNRQPSRSTPVRLQASIAIAVATLAAMTAQAQNSAPPLRKYVGSPDYPALLKEPAVKAKLQAVVGKQLPALMRNLDVTGDMGLVSGAITISGNASHKGGEEEGVICVAEYDSTLQAAILSKGRITVFAKDNSYDNLMICIKDWITQVNSGHRDRFTQPKNVQFGRPN